ncbi:putative phospholipase/carboxylesterase/thioesterase, alpha/Beta hydrolase [Helianthus annuus]|nr:putative phospholipase/carboxylesterase/thioesterase, alpha/Beta hydrolase [Helianthus annuus]
MALVKRAQVGLRSWKHFLFQMSMDLPKCAKSTINTIWWISLHSVVQYRKHVRRPHVMIWRAWMLQQTHVANLLISEPDDVKLGVAGFSMGASVALYSAACRAIGQYGNGNRYPINLSAAVALSGWLLHVPVDDVVEYKLGEKSAQTMYSAGFQNLTFQTYNGLGHYTILEEINDVCCWLNTYLGA